MTTTTGVATSFIDFTRASNATVTDSDGKVKWAPHNLLTNSESFDAASWTKDNLLAFGSGSSANAIGAPNATTTADLITPDTTGTMHRIFMASGITVPTATPHTYGVFVRANGYTKVALRENATTGDYAAFELTGAGSVLDKTVGATASVSALSNSWYYITATFSSAATAITLGVYVLSPSYTTGSILGVWVANGTSGIYLWGAALYRSDLGGMQPNTSAYPLYNPTTPKNLVGYTEDFSNAYWSKSNLAAAPVIANAILAPNGLQTADKIVEDTTTNTHSISKTGIAVNIGSQNTVSISVKGSGRTQCMLQYFDGTTNKTPVFSLADGTKVVDGGIGSSWSAVSQGDGWWRFSITVTTATASAGIYVYPCVSGSASYTGDGTSGIYLWGAQLSDSASLDPYSPVYGAAVTSAAYYGPRRDFDPVTLACKGLLVEEQRTNLLLYSTDFLNATYWSLYASATIAANSIVSPDGLTTSYTVTGSGSNFSSLYQNRPSTNGAVYTSSVYVKAGTASFAFILLDAGVSARWVNLSTGEITGSAGPIVSAVATPVGNGWYRVAIAYTATSTNNAGLFVGPASASLSQTSTGTIYAWGAQTELGSFATSYIPTTGAATATRNADVASVSTQAFPYSASESTIVASASTIGPGGAASGSVLLALKGASGNGLTLYQPANTYSLVAYVDASNVSLGTSSLGAIEKLAIAYNGVSNGAVRNGGAVSSVGTTVAVAANLFYLGNNIGGVFNGHIRQITYLPRRISNAELQTRTS